MGAGAKCLFLAPAERADVIVDFAGQAGKTFTMKNFAVIPFPSGGPTGFGAPDATADGLVMQFKVDLPLQGTDTTFNPAGSHPALRAAPIVNIKTIAPNKKRQLILVEEEGDTANPDGPGSPVDDGDPVESLINNTKWNGNREGTTTLVPGSVSNGHGVSATETPQEGSMEVWEIANLTGDAHPIHIHLIQFQVISRQTFDVDSYLTDWMAAFPGGTFNGFNFPPGIYIPGFGPPLTYNVLNSAGALGGNLNFDATKYLQQGACAGGACPLRAPEALDSGWKDTIKMFPGEITRIAVRWAPQDIAANGTTAGQDPFPFDPTNGPGYVEHCHILDHEDNEFMRPMLDRQVIVALRLLLLAAAAVALTAAVVDRSAWPCGHDRARRSRYACPMHPEVRADAPGECPICRMALERVGSRRPRRPGPPPPTARTSPRWRMSAGTTSSTSSAGARCWSRPASCAARHRSTPTAPSSALFYDDQIAALDDDELGTFTPTAAPERRFSRPPRAGRPPSAWDRSTSRVRFRFTAAGRDQRTTAGPVEVGWVELAPRPRQVLAVPASARPAVAGGSVRAGLDGHRLQLREAAHRDRRDLPQAGVRGRALRPARERARGGSRATFFVDADRRAASRAGETGWSTRDRPPRLLVRAPPLDRHRRRAGGRGGRRSGAPAAVARRGPRSRRSADRRGGGLDGTPGAGGRRGGDARADRGARRACPAPRRSAARP